MLDGLDTHIPETRALGRQLPGLGLGPSPLTDGSRAGASPGADSNVAKIALGLTNN